MRWRRRDGDAEATDATESRPAAPAPVTPWGTGTPAPAGPDAWDEPSATPDPAEGEDATPADGSSDTGAGGSSDTGAGRSSDTDSEDVAADPVAPPAWLGGPADTDPSSDDESSDEEASSDDDGPDAPVVAPSGRGDAWDLPGTPAPAVEDVPRQLGEIDEDELRVATRRAVARALAEDLGDVGDVTTAATVPALREGTADVVARADGVVAGLHLLREVFAQVDPRVRIEVARQDGDRVSRGDVVASVSGRLRSILTAERTALNFLCHLSGVATQTRRYADAIEGTDAVVRDTRKTTPGLRLLEKAAVAAGGGTNHRVGLYDALLVKDNHVLAAGSSARAARAAMERSGGRHVQVEVSSLDEVDSVLRAGVVDILLDNFTPEEVRLAVRRVAGRASLEASGNVTLDTIRSYAETGVDRIACGALTHSAPWLDLALDVRPDEPGDPRDPAAAAAGTTPTAQPWTADEGPDLPTSRAGRFSGGGEA